MGFLNRIFGPPQPVSCTLEEAMKRIIPELHAMDASQKDELFATASHIFSEFAGMNALIRTFSKKPGPPNAKSSEKVKERFCEIAEKQLSGLARPEKENPGEFLSLSRDLINSLGGLTERQILHLGFFFKDDIQPIARKMKAINELLLKSAGQSADHARAVQIYSEIKDLEGQKKHYEKEAAEIAGRVKSMESKKEAHTLPEDRVDNSYLLISEKKLQKLRQEIDSFLSVQKLLKKYSHDKNIHDDLIDAYINSPSSAVAEDRSLRILKIIMAARSYDDTGKAESIIDREDYLREKQRDLTGAQAAAEEEKQKYEAESRRVAAATIEARRKLAALETEIRDARKSEEEYRAGAAQLSSKLAAKRTELCLLASKILGTNVA